MTESYAPLPGFRIADAWKETDRGNMGLWYDKHCHRWEPDYSGLLEPKREDKKNQTKAYEGGRIDWLNAMIRAARQKNQGDLGPELSLFAARQQAYASALDGCVFQARTAVKFATGLGRAHPVQNGFEWHHTLGVPVVRSSGQKGMVWDWVRTWDPQPDDERNRILGTPESSGTVDFLPALPTAPSALCIDGTTPHFTKYYQSDNDTNPPADWYDPTPLQWLAVAPGATFQFAVVPRGGHKNQKVAREDVKRAAQWLESALTTIGAGAATAVDRGRFEQVKWVAGRPNKDT
jgi:CRISPR-associated protein Cmr6